MRRPRRASPERIAGTVYGTIVVMGALAAGAHGGGIRALELAGIVAGTVIVLWLSHVYAHSLGESIHLDRRLDRAELASVARRELAIPLAAVAPIAALMLGAAGVVEDSTAGWLAVALGLVALAAAGLFYARAERLGFIGTAAVIGVNLCLGLLLVALKAGLAH